MNFCLAVIASEQSERGNPKSKNNAKFMDCHAVFAKTARNDAFAVILSVSEVSKNDKFSFNLCGFFAFLQRLKMIKRAQKPKNKAFKKFSVPKSASNEREVPRPNTAPFSLCLLRPQTLATLNLLRLLCCAIEFCHAVPFRFQTHHATLCCALLNL